MNKETKSLSQQLCELCGVKPRYYVRALGNTPRNEIIRIAYRRIKNYTEAKTVFIDFENPENFVKLFELDVNEAMCLSFIISLDSVFGGRKGFLKSLLQHIARGNATAEEIKQAIRNYDGWVWG